MNSLGEFTTLKKTKEFGYIYNNGKKFHTQTFLLFYKKSPQKRVGFTASKKVGNAVKRNFAKRRLRSAFLSCSEILEDGIYVFVAKKEITNQPFAKIEKSLHTALKKLGALRKNAKNIT